MGSVPLAKDVSQLAGLHIGLVINLCREYSGPTDSSYDLSSCWNKIFYSESGYRYEDYGIMQFRVPTADLCEPDYHQLLLGIKCIQNYFNNQKKKNNCEKNKKIYIHCKAGRHRASIFTLCYLISCNYNPEEAILLMKEKRHVVVKSIINSSLIQKFIKNYNQNGKNVDRMIESVVNNSTNHQ